MYTEILKAQKPDMNHELTEARPERLAFFLPQVLDIKNIKSFQREVLSFAGLLRSPNIVDEAIRASLRQGMEEALAAVENLVQSDNGTLLISIPAEYQGSAAFQAMADEFSTEAHEEGMPFRVLSIPSDKITAAKVLPYPSKPGEDDYQPVLTMRVVDSGHEQGAWHYIPLATSEFLFYED